MTIALDSLDRCFHGMVPAIVTTCSSDGIPNVGYLSQVQYVDPRHVALSCQFFNKTRQNLDQNPRATIELCDPVTFDAYRLHLRFVRSETSGPLFDEMALRILAIASHTGMAGVFKLRSADVCEVEAVEAVVGYLAPATDGDDAPHGLPADGPLTELRGLQLVSERVNRAGDLDSLLGGALEALEDVFGFAHSMVLVPEERGDRLITLASRGYGENGVGAEVRVGDGLIGSVAAQRKLLRVASIDSDMRYARAIRARVHEVSGPGALAPEIPLPGLPDAQSQLAMPLMVGDRLIGVLALEARDSMVFAPWHEAFLQILANQIAFAIDRMIDRPDDDGEPAPVVSRMVTPPSSRRRSFCLYLNDDCVFVDGEYLIRNVPAKILWKLLRAHRERGQIEFTNRELRLDPALGLPPFKDNLESRLILLRRRLEERCPDVRLVPVRRGRFALELGCAVDLDERETA